MVCGKKISLKISIRNFVQGRKDKMKKIVVIINGSGGVGKDTLCDIVGKYYDVMNISSIDPIKKIAIDNGWNGEKNEKSRKFLAELKNLFVDFNDLPQRYLMKKYSDFLQSKKQVLFVHIREPKEIEKFKNEIQIECVTLLIRGRVDIKTEWNNAADDDVEQYEYDFYYDNCKNLEGVEADFLQFFKTILARVGKR